MNKYRNVKHRGFDSKKEARRYDELKWMELAGEISDLKTQVKFELVPSQRINNKVVERAVNYIADFTYMKDGELVVEDVKGYTRNDSTYIIKRKLLLWVKGIRIHEV